jgi:hypothetical protein
MLKDKLEQLNNAFTTLKEKIKNKLELQQKTLNESNHKLETTLKENQENEKVLEQLAKEFKELEEELC